MELACKFYAYHSVIGMRGTCAYHVHGLNAQRVVLPEILPKLVRTGEAAVSGAAFDLDTFPQHILLNGRVKLFFGGRETFVQHCP
jgi:hypothetical protein